MPRDAGALRADGFFGDLNQDILSALDMILDVGKLTIAPASASASLRLAPTGAPPTTVLVVLVLVVWFEQIRCVKESAFFGADVDERCLHPR